MCQSVCVLLLSMLTVQPKVFAQAARAAPPLP